MVYELARAQQALGAKVEIWAPSRSQRGPDAAQPFVRYFPGNYFMGGVGSAAIADAIGRLGADTVLHAHNTFNRLNLDVGRAAARAGLRCYYHPHGALDPTLFAGLRFSHLKKKIYVRCLEVPNLNRSAGVFALSDFESAQLREVGVTAPIHILPNGMAPVAANPGWRRQFRQRHAIAGDALVVLYVGRIDWKKRLEDILDAAAALGSGVVLVVAGDVAAAGQYGRSLQARAQRFGSNCRVIWAGFLAEEAKAEALAAADIFVHASVSEGMAMAILEAMAAGLPAVVTKGCYMRQAAQAGAVIECDQGAAALAAAMRPLIECRDKRVVLGEAAREYVRHVHDWRVIALKTLEIYGMPSKTVLR